MLFNVDQDLGTRILAYVVPDSAGTTPSVVLRSGGVELARVEANVTKEHLVEVGRHSTGRCGFDIDATQLPGIETYDDLEIVEASSDVLVYRRPLPDACELSVFRLETHLLPLWRVDDAVRPRFRHWYKGVERHGLETATQVFCLNDPKGRYVSGRLLYRNFEMYLVKGITTACLLRDPYHELAERLLLLKNVGAMAGDVLGERDALLFGHLVEELRNVPDFEDASCRRFFKRTPPDVLAVVSNPLVRQMTCATPDEFPSGSCVATSLDAFAAFDVLGLRSDPEGFATTLGEVLGVAPADMPVVAEFPRVKALGERLRKLHDVEALLEKDLEVFHAVAGAFQTAETRASA